MGNIKLDTTKAVQFLAKGAVEGFEAKARAAQEALENGTCAGNDFLGWLHLPSETTDAFLDGVCKYASKQVRSGGSCRHWRLLPWCSRRY